MNPYGTGGAYGSATGDSSSEDELKLALIKGRWSFSIRPPNTPVVFEASSLITVDVPAWAARPWTINLCAFRYSGGDLTVGNGPPDSQTLTLPRYRARITWGVDGSTDTALVDYYARGCTMQVHGGNIRVDVLAVVASASPTAPLPKLSGYISPTARAFDPALSPTLTTDVQALLAATQVTLPIPDRAVAYRVVYLSLPATPLINTAQRSSTTQVQEDGAQDGANFFQQGNRAGFIPLHPEAQFVRVINTGAVLQSVALSFLLDLG